MTAANEYVIEGLFGGPAVNRWSGRPPSAIDKKPMHGPQILAAHGFESDQQADLAVHGGADKAVHHYAADHYAAWQTENLMAPGTRPAAFGENISTSGLVEADVCIGDTFRLGTAVVQVSQGRQPCWKLNAHTGQDKMAYLFQKLRRTGWYYRVLEPGKVAAGDTLTRIEHLHPKWSIATVTHLRLTKQITKDDAITLANLPELATGWRDAFAKMASGSLTEDTRKRLNP